MNPSSNNGYIQPHFPPSNSHPQHRSSGPPPAKRPRGNPIITRYPPPPGYRGPAQPLPQYPSPSWAQPSPYQQPNFSHYPGPPHGPPTPLSAPYSPYQTPQSHLSPNVYTPHSAQSWPGSYAGWQTPVNGPRSAPVASWQHQQSHDLSTQQLHRHNSAPVSTHDQGWQGPLDGNGDPLEPLAVKENTSDDPDDLESEYDGECYFARHPEEINPDLSLGLIEWKAAVPTHQPLPSSFADAERDPTGTRALQVSGDGCVSQYFTAAKREEALLSVRQLDIWDEVKDDLIYREFSPVCHHLISFRDLMEYYRRRFDTSWIEPGLYASPDSSRASTPSIQTNAAQEKALAALGVSGLPKPAPRKRSLNRDEYEDDLPRKQQRFNDFPNHQ